MGFATEVELPPSTNHLFATVGRRRVTTSAYRSWQAVAALKVRTLQPAKAYPVAVTLTVLGKVYAQRDLDNFVKPVLDALVKCGTLAGDSLQYVSRVTVQRGDASGEPRVRIELEGGAG